MFPPISALVAVLSVIFVDVTVARRAFLSPRARNQKAIDDIVNACPEEVVRGSG